MSNLNNISPQDKLFKVDNGQKVNRNIYLYGEEPWSADALRFETIDGPSKLQYELDRFRVKAPL